MPEELECLERGIEIARIYNGPKLEDILNEAQEMLDIGNVICICYILYDFFIRNFEHCLVTEMCEENFPNDKNLSNNEKIQKMRILGKECKDLMHKAASSVDLERDLNGEFLDSIAGSVNAAFVNTPCTELNEILPTIMKSIKDGEFFKKAVEHAVKVDLIPTGETNEQAESNSSPINESIELTEADMSPIYDWLPASALD